MDTTELDPDPVWTDRFHEEEERVRTIPDPDPLAVHHVGSTAIADLAGKRALDVIAVYPDESTLQAVAQAIGAADGRYEITADEGNCVVVARFDDDEVRLLKLHVAGDERVENQLLARAYLRDHPEARREYEAIKREAAAEHPNDVGEYTAAKGEFVADLLERAREAGYAEEIPETW